MGNGCPCHRVRCFGDRFMNSFSGAGIGFAILAVSEVLRPADSVHMVVSHAYALTAIALLIAGSLIELADRLEKRKVAKHGNDLSGPPR